MGTLQFIDQQRTLSLDSAITISCFFARFDLYLILRYLLLITYYRMYEMSFYSFIFLLMIINSYFAYISSQPSLL